MKKPFLTLSFILITLLVSQSVLTEVEYNSVHDETYWFPNKEFTLEGFNIGSVRSNLVWGDRMMVFVNEDNCGLEKPQIRLNLTTKKVKTEFPDFDFSSLEGKSMELSLNFDGKYIERNRVQIVSTLHFENGNHAVQLNLGDVYDTFLAIDEKYGTLLGWQVLTLKIQENDPNRRYFDLPERQYRMGGFLPVMVHLIEECKKKVKAK